MVDYDLRLSKQIDVFRILFIKIMDVRLDDLPIHFQAYNWSFEDGENIVRLRCRVEAWKGKDMY